MSISKTTVEQSEELAMHIDLMKAIIQAMDLEYAKLAAKEMMEQAHWQDSAMVLNPSHIPAKTQLLMKQAKSLCKLVEFVEMLRECDQLREEVERNEAVRDKINKLFI